MDLVSGYISMDENIRISELPLSRRTLNVLKRTDGLDFGNDTIKDLERVSLMELREWKNAGLKTLYELGKFFLYAGIKALPG